MYCLTIRNVHNNEWADNYYFETKEEAETWSTAMYITYANKDGFREYQWEITKVKTTKRTLDAFMGDHGIYKCLNTVIACPNYTQENSSLCGKCRK
jgi:hypothetical protein